MIIGSDVYVSDTFNFSRQLYPQVGFSCTDSVLIYWDKINGINQYKVYQLGSKYLEAVTTIADTNIILHNTISPFVAVTTVFDSSQTGVNSYTFNYNTQGVTFYMAISWAVSLTIMLYTATNLGTILDLKGASIPGITANKWNTIATMQPVTNTELNYEDSSLHNGINTYRSCHYFKQRRYYLWLDSKCILFQQQYFCNNAKSLTQRTKLNYSFQQFFY